MNSPVDYKGFTEDDALAVSEISKKYNFINPVLKIYKFEKDFAVEEYIKLLSTYPDHMALEENLRKGFFSEIKKTIVENGGIITVNYICDLHLCTKP